MYYFKKIFISIISALMLISVIGPSVNAIATEEPTEDITVENNEQYESKKDDLENELQYFFEEIGYINENGQYVITDIEAFEKETNTAVKVSSSTNNTGFQTANAGEYVTCVIVNSIPLGGAVWELADAASQHEGLINALQSLNFEVASELILSIGRDTLSEAAFQELSNISIVANLATSIGSCAIG